MERQKKPLRKRQAREPDEIEMPDAIPPPIIGGPSASELRAHGSKLLTHAQLVKQLGDDPTRSLDGHELSDRAIQAREAHLSLSVLGLAEVYADRLQGLSGAVKALEARVFSEEHLANMSSSQMLNLYQLAMASQERGGAFILKALATVNLEAVRNKLKALGIQPDTPAVQAAVVTTAQGKKETTAMVPVGPQATQMLHRMYVEESENEN